MIVHVAINAVAGPTVINVVAGSAATVVVARDAVVTRYGSKVRDGMWRRSRMSSSSLYGHSSVGIVAIAALAGYLLLNACRGGAI